MSQNLELETVHVGCAAVRIHTCCTVMHYQSTIHDGRNNDVHHSEPRSTPTAVVATERLAVEDDGESGPAARLEK